MDPRHGDEVKLNQAVSIWLSIGEIYLVYREKDIQVFLAIKERSAAT